MAQGNACCHHHLIGGRDRSVGLSLRHATYDIDGSGGLDRRRHHTANVGHCKPNGFDQLLGSSQIFYEETDLEAVKVFSAGRADLTIAHGNVGDLSAARTVVLVTYGVVLILVPPGSSIDSMDQLKGRTVGVIGGEVNFHVVETLIKEYDLESAKVRFKNIARTEIQQALKSRQVHALLVVMPISEKYLAMLRDLFPRNSKQKIGLIPIELAGAIAAIARSYESFDLPKGTICGSPPVPDDDLTTLRIPYYLIANKKLNDGVVTALTKAIMDIRRDLVGEFPLLAHIRAPSMDKDAHMPIHPGAAVYFEGDQKTFFDKYGDQLFYGSMLFGSLTWILAGVWKFMVRKTAGPERRPLERLYALADRIANAHSDTELADAERRIEEIFADELAKAVNGDAETGELVALELATRRLENPINRRRGALRPIPDRHSSSDGPRLLPEHPIS